MTERSTQPVTESRGRTLVAVVLVLVAVLAGVNWLLDPSKASRWLFRMLQLPVLWLALTIWQRWMLRSRARRGFEDEAAVRYYFDSVSIPVIVLVGAVYIVRSCLVIWTTVGNGDPDIARRLLLLSASAFVILLGNRIPKMVTPLSMLPRGGAVRLETARRFVGLVWVLLGLTMAVAFLFAPLELATLLPRWMLGACMLTVLAAVIWMNAGPVGGEQWR
ncbi:MAG: hypothetical protein PVJ49_13295 [Acidobacteriota bacterium]|jgi:hypothetical protein